MYCLSLTLATAFRTYQNVEIISLLDGEQDHSTKLIAINTIIPLKLISISIYQGQSSQGNKTVTRSFRDSGGNGDDDGMVRIIPAMDYIF